MIESKRERALQDVRDLERLTGNPLHGVPVFVLDQWGAGIRDVFAALEAELVNPLAAKAAFAGAYVAIGIITDGAMLRDDTLLTMSHVLRWLYERGEVSDELLG